MKTFTFYLCGVLFVMGFLGVACSDKDSNEKICDPGIVQRCPCAGGKEGTQICSDDGTRWGACEYCSVADGDTNEQEVNDGDRSDGDSLDGDTSETTDGDGMETDDPDGDGNDAEATESDMADGDAADKEAPDGDVVELQENDVIETEMSEAEPEIEAEREPESEETEVEGETGINGRCSVTGEPCSDLIPCTAGSAEVQGRCSKSSLGSNYTCLYAPRYDLPTEYTCGAVSFDHCGSNFDCPLGIGCGGLGASWCAAGSEQISNVCLSSVTLNFGSTPCLNDSQCTQTLQNVCVIVGNNTVDTNQEECDDGNTRSGDGCSETGQFEGQCYSSGTPLGFTYECAKDEDCYSVLECSSETCVCQFP